MHRPKDTDWLGRWEHMHVYTSTYHITLLNPSVCMQLFYIVRLIMFLLWLAIVIIFYFLSGYWLWKLINIYYCCDYVTIISLTPLCHDWSTENNRILYHKSYHLIEKTCNHFLKFRCITELSWNFLRSTNAQVLLLSPKLQVFLMSNHV